MKILPDDTLFTPLPMKMQFNKNGTRVYHTFSQKNVHRHFLLPLTGITQVLYIPVLFQGKVDKRYRYRQENASVLGIEYVREGSLLVRQGNFRCLLEPGDIFLLRPGENNEILTGPEGYCVKDSFPVTGTLLNDYLEKSALNRKECVVHFDRKRLEELLTKLLELAADPTPENIRTNGIVTYEILELLAYPAPKPDMPPETVRLLEYIRNHLDGDLSLESLIRESGLSENTLNRMFHKFFGKTPHAAVIEFRMERAAALLLSEKHPSIKEIAQITGYPDPMNFSTAFRRFYGTGPRAYREQKKSYF